MTFILTVQTTITVQYMLDWLKEEKQNLAPTLLMLLEQECNNVNMKAHLKTKTDKRTNKKVNKLINMSIMG